jgi:hypothetical protein
VENEPLFPYLVGTQIDIENVPLGVIKLEMKNYGHYIVENYVYGIKFVTKDFKHMFATDDDPPYEK